ncbi:MAG: hypothetical protein OXS35_08060, partial [Dehalococcoidia bacterium]|nr:hypothetical protein [Dehalococcoidia bacterium]
MRLVIFAGSTLILSTLAIWITGITYAGGDPGCIVGSSNLNSGTSYVMYVETTADHIHTESSGLSGVSVSRVSSFCYSGIQIEVPDGNIFRIRFTVTSPQNELGICFHDDVGLWSPVESGRDANCEGSEPAPPPPPHPTPPPPPPPTP